MNQIPHCNWLPEGARQSYFARSGFLAWFRWAKIIPSYNKSFIYAELRNMFGQDGWLFASFFLCVFMDRDKNRGISNNSHFFLLQTLIFLEKNSRQVNSKHYYSLVRVVVPY